MPLSLYPHFTGDPDKKAYEFIDTVLLSAPDDIPYRYEDIIKQSDLPQLEKDIAKHINSQFRNLILRDLKYIEPVPNDTLKCRLTPLGKLVKKSGGHLTYLQILANKELSDKKR